MNFAMVQILGKNKEKTVYLVLFTLILTSVIFAAIFFKNDKEIVSQKTNISQPNEEITLIKEFFLQKIKSPFINIDYEIKSGDSIQKILKQFKIRNKEIQSIITQYKKYGNANQLLAGNKINIIVEENLSNKDNSIVKFSVPITKSTIIEISKNNEEDKIFSKKIITKLYKKNFIAENVITNNLYSSATDANINPDTIIEFARIFGFEVDFQRYIRKNDYFRIVYDKYIDENGEFIKSGSILYAYMSVNGHEIALYKFGDDQTYNYFDINGKSVEKALMKTPINGARLSSSFGMRKHPILGLTKCIKVLTSLHEKEFQSLLLVVEPLLNLDGAEEEEIV